MPDTPSLTIIKKFTFRGKDEEWSNKYHFTGATPGTDAAWKTLADAVIAIEKTLYSASHSVVRAYGYEAGNEHSVAQIDYSAPPLAPIPGTLPSESNYNVQAGDAAYWVRARTPNRGANGKWIYIRKYFHGGFANGSGEVQPSMKSRGLAFANAMLDGSLPGGAKWSGPQGAPGASPDVSKYITTRTLKRRGKRPSS